MEKILEKIQFVYPEYPQLKGVQDLSPDKLFSEIAVAFLNELSIALTKHTLIRNYPDVATFAFFCRKANILSFKKEYETRKIRWGRGVIFHVAPSNVPVNFAYSLIAGLLSGNVNLVRLPSKEYPQVELICQVIKDILVKPEYKNIAERIYLFRYDRTDEVTAYFSAICDVRVIWGGDQTIANIRKNPLSPRAYDLTFADRYSFCVINADRYVEEKHPEKIALDFYNDTYLFDQNACSAPHLVVWTGKKELIRQARDTFWTHLQHVLDVKGYSLPEVMAVNKLTSFYLQSISHTVQKESFQDNRLWRINLNELPSDIDEYRCAGGYFSEYIADSMADIRKIVNRKYQTMAYYGFSKEELISFFSTPLTGIDRIVPLGKTTDFSFTWDGYDLLLHLSRECVIL